MRLTIHRSNFQGNAKNCTYDIKCLIENMEQKREQKKNTKWGRNEENNYLEVIINSKSYYISRLTIIN